MDTWVTGIGARTLPDCYCMAAGTQEAHPLHRLCAGGVSFFFPSSYLLLRVGPFGDHGFMWEAGLFYPFALSRPKASQTDARLSRQPQCFAQRLARFRWPRTSQSLPLPAVSPAALKLAGKKSGLSSSAWTRPGMVLHTDLTFDFVSSIGRVFKPILLRPPVPQVPCELLPAAAAHLR